MILLGSVCIQCTVILYPYRYNLVANSIQYFMQTSSCCFYYIFLFYICIPQSWLDEYAQHVLGPTSNFFSWCARQSLTECIPDGGTIMMLSKFLRQNITVVSGEDMWSVEDTSLDIVVGYLNSGRYIPTTHAAQQEVGTYCLFNFLLK